MPFSCSILQEPKRDPVSARLHSHSLGNSYTDYIHRRPIISVEKRMILTATGFRDSTTQREILAVLRRISRREINWRNIPRDKLKSRNVTLYTD